MRQQVVWWQMLGKPCTYERHFFKSNLPIYSEWLILQKALILLCQISSLQFTPSLELVCLYKGQCHKKWVFLLFLGCFQCNDIGLHFYGASIITKTTRVFFSFFFFKAPTTFTALFWRKKYLVLLIFISLNFEYLPHFL